MMKEEQKPTGTREWAVGNVNIQTGCEHECAYCYARANAMRFKQIENLSRWAYPVINRRVLNKTWKKRNGILMFPSTHDITPGNLEACLKVLGNLLLHNSVLIVSKPHLVCISEICKAFPDRTDRILFRFSIGSHNSNVLKVWEPGAPDFEERLASLRYAFADGFRTSVSAEPYLDEWVENLYGVLQSAITDSFWIGPMNHMDTRVRFNFATHKDAMKDKKLWTVDQWDAWEAVKACQTKEFIEALYERMKAKPKVRWKIAIKEMLGLPVPEEIGLDI